MTEGNDSTRRRFLKATGAASVTAAVAGCTGDGGGGTTTGANNTTGGMTGTTEGMTGTTEGMTGTTDTSTPLPVNFDKYPYGIGETQIQEAKKVMEDAGYGPNNRYELRWLQYRSPSYKEMANTIRSRLEAAHIDMSISQANFGPLLSKSQAGNVDAFTLGWIADYPAPDNFLQLVDPPRTNYSKPNATGAYLYWTEDSYHGKGRQWAIDQFNRVENNPQPSQEAQQIRNDAYRKMEEAVWNDVPMVMNTHGIAEPMWYDRVDWELHGAMGGSRQKDDRTAVSGRDQLSLVNATITTLDPIKSTDTAGGTVIMNVFDALTNYRNGTTAVENLLAESFTTNDDFTEYTFKLKEGVAFHEGRGELTASDMVYSLRRLAESTNSNRVGFLADFLGISHRAVVVKTDDKGNVVDKKTVDSGNIPDGYSRKKIVPNSIAVEAVSDSELKITLDKPFASSLAMLAYSSFSAVPEGIVGDIEGYEGEMEYSKFAKSNPIGCGPFSFGNWTQGEEVFVERFPPYHRGPAEESRIHWQIIEDSNAAYNYFINENSDIGGVPTGQYSRDKVNIQRTDDRGRQIGTYGPLKNGKTVNYARIPEVSTFYVGFNCQNVEMPVRKAMAHVTNMQEFVKNIFKGRSIPAYHLTPPTIFPGGKAGYDKHYQG